MPGDEGTGTARPRGKPISSGPVIGSAIQSEAGIAEDVFPFKVRCIDDGAFFSASEDGTVIPARPGEKTCLTKGKVYEVLGINKTFGWWVMVDDSEQGTYMYPPSRFLRI